MPLRIGVGRRLARDTPLTSPYTDLQRGGTCCGGQRRCGMTGAHRRSLLHRSSPDTAYDSQQVHGGCAERGKMFQPIPAADEAIRAAAYPAARLVDQAAGVSRQTRTARGPGVRRAKARSRRRSLAGRHRVRGRSWRGGSRRQRVSARRDRADGQELLARRRRDQRARAPAGDGTLDRRRRRRWATAAATRG